MRVSSDHVLSLALCTLAWYIPRLTANAAGLPSLSDVQTRASKHLSCCAVLDFFLPGEVSAPASPAYNGSLLSYWSQQEQQVSPACIVGVKSAQDVATAVFVLNIASQIINNDGCKFAVRSGGYALGVFQLFVETSSDSPSRHTAFAGSANIQGGVTIDLQSLNQIDVAPDKQTVAIGPGNRWDAVYLKLDAMGLAISGGRVASVGVGGLILGGIPLTTSIENKLCVKHLQAESPSSLPDMALSATTS